MAKALTRAIHFAEEVRRRSIFPSRIRTSGQVIDVLYSVIGAEHGDEIP
jgi:hypothetical protein